MKLLRDPLPKLLRDKKILMYVKQNFAKEVDKKIAVWQKMPMWNKILLRNYQNCFVTKNTHVKNKILLRNLLSYPLRKLLCDKKITHVGIFF